MQRQRQRLTRRLYLIFRGDHVSCIQRQCLELGAPEARLGNCIDARIARPRVGRSRLLNRRHHGDDLELKTLASLPRVLGRGAGSGKLCAPFC